MNKHIPVLLKEILCISPNNPSIIIDGTFGNGGYSSALLEKFPNATLYAFDRDENVLPRVKEMEKKYGKRFKFINETFSHISDLKIKADYMIFDLGLSSMQIDEAKRGFSYSQEGPLCMQMGKNEISAYEIINNFSSTELGEIFKKYGEEKASFSIANRIAKLRVQNPIETTTQLKKICDETARDGKAAARIFQAIRIYINDELGQLESILKSAPLMLNNGGVLGIVSFHSLEDSSVKEEFNKLTQQEKTSRYLPQIFVEKYFTLGKKGAIKPSEEEVENNQRSRSARLRYITRK